MPQERVWPRRAAGAAATREAPLAPPDFQDPLIAALASAAPAEVEKAQAALAARGAAAVPALIRCLESDFDGLRLRALSLLALQGDQRATGPVCSLLRHPDAAVRTRAAGALARMAAPAATAALARLLAHESETPVRLACARSLVRLVQTGHDEALRPLLGATADPAEDPRVRTIALDAIPWAAGPADASSVRTLLSRLADDGVEPLARKARRLLTGPLRPRLEPWAVEALLGDLRSERLSVWRRAVSRLGQGGGVIVEPLLEALAKEPESAQFARRAALVLKALSPRQLSRLGPFIDVLDQPAALEAIVDVAAHAGSPALLARLAALIRRLADGPEAAGPGRLDGVRRAAHLALARHGSRLAVDDLRRLLEDRRFPVRPEIAEAAAMVGARRELRALLEAYRRSRGVARLALREAVLAVCRREKIRRTDRALAGLEPAECMAAVEILGAPRRRQGRRPIGRIDRPGASLLT